jgi:predicted transcriptional regulator
MYDCNGRLSSLENRKEKDYGEGFSMKKGLDKVKEEMKVEPKVIKSYTDFHKAKAEKIAKNGNPLLFLVETVAKIHSREKDSILLLLLSGLSSGLYKRQFTIHTMAVGSSGKGKTAVMDSTSKSFTKVQRITSSSAKSQFYKSEKGAMIDKGILVFDEAENSKDAQALERVYTDMTGGNPSHETVDKEGKFKRIEIKERNAVWRNSVNTPEDNEGQLCNRYIMFNVDESSTQDYIVYKHQIDKLAFGGDEIKELEDFKVCQALTDLIKEIPIKVFIPFAHLIQPSRKSNRRSFPKFLSFIRCVTYAFRFQREKIKDYYVATFDDFEVAKLVWDKVNRMEHLHVRETNQKILAVLTSQEWMSVDSVVENPDIKMSRATVARALHEMKTKGYVDSRKLEGYSNKYEWQAFHNLSQLLINFSKQDFTIDELKQSINTLLTHIDSSTSQDFIKTVGQEDLYRKITAQAVTCGKLRSLIHKDGKRASVLNKQVDEAVSQDEKSVKSSQELEVIEEFILDNDLQEVVNFVQNKISINVEKLKDEFGDERVDKLIDIEILFLDSNQNVTCRKT